MKRIAVCDSDQETVEQLLRCLGRIPGVGPCDGFSDPLEWRKHREENDYQAVFLDCAWEEEAEGVGQDTKVIWLSGEPEKYIQHLLLRHRPPFGFLIKPVREELLRQYMQKLLEGGGMYKDSILVRSKGTVHTIRYEEIIFLESTGHVVEIWTREGSYSCYGRLDKFLEQLPEYFIQCHKSYLVNMRAIRCIDRNWILMDQGRLVPISKSRYSETRDKYIRYMGGSIWDPEPKTE